MKFLLGVDEAGRGPLAGPVAVGVVSVPVGFDVAAEFPGVADSKAISEKKREALFALLEERTRLGDVQFVVELPSAEAIDREGIAVVIREAISRAVNQLARDAAEAHVLLDGVIEINGGHVRADINTEAITLSVRTQHALTPETCPTTLVAPVVDFQLLGSHTERIPNDTAQQPRQRCQRHHTAA